MSAWNCKRVNFIILNLLLRNPRVSQGLLLSSLLDRQSTRRATTICRSMSSSAFRDFLKERYERPTSHIVLGNPAGDTDSILSALTLGFVEEDKELLTPVVSIPRRDLQTQRPETSLLLELAGVPTDKLWFQSDLKSRFWQDAETTVTLVDHNRHVYNQGEVVEIIDHHMDEGCHPNAKRLIAFADGKATVASTGTLVVERMQELNRRFPADVALLLLGLLLIDSVNLSPAAGKATPRDAAAVQLLLEDTDWSSLSESTREKLKIAPKPDTDALFDVLQGAKFDPGFWDALAVRDALRLDFKDFSGGSTRFGMSSVLLPLARFVKKKELTAGIQEYMEEIEVDFLAIMLAHTDSQSQEETLPLKREMILCGKNNFPLARLTDMLTKENLTLQLYGLDDVGQSDVNNDVSLRLFRQDNAKASRKQVAPILIQYFESQTDEQSHL